MIPNKNQATINPWFCLRVPSFKTYATPLIKLFNEVSREIFLFDSQLSRWLKTLHTGIVTRFNFLDASKNRHIKLASYVKYCGFFPITPSSISLSTWFTHGPKLRVEQHLWKVTIFFYPMSAFTRQNE